MHPKGLGCRGGEEEVGEGTVQFIKAYILKHIESLSCGLNNAYFLPTNLEVWPGLGPLDPVGDQSLGASGEEMTSDKAGRSQRGLSTDLCPALTCTLAFSEPQFAKLEQVIFRGTNVVNFSLCSPLCSLVLLTLSAYHVWERYCARDTGKILTLLELMLSWSGETAKHETNIQV